MPLKRRKPLGSRLPAVKEIAAPNDELLDRVQARFDALVPEWAGLFDPKAPGTKGARFYRDEVTGIVTRARDGLIVTAAVKRRVMDLYTQRVRGVK